MPQTLFFLIQDLMISKSLYCLNCLAPTASRSEGPTSLGRMRF